MIQTDNIGATCNYSCTLNSKSSVIVKIYRSKSTYTLKYQKWDNLALGRNCFKFYPKFSESKLLFLHSIQCSCDSFPSVKSINPVYVKDKHSMYIFWYPIGSQSNVVLWQKATSEDGDGKVKQALNNQRSKATTQGKKLQRKNKLAPFECPATDTLLLSPPPGKIERSLAFLFFSSGAMGSGLVLWLSTEESRLLLFILSGGAGGFSSFSKLSDIFRCSWFHSS